MPWIVDDPVEVRATSALPWRAGVVTEVMSHCYRVTLDTPLAADTWMGITRKYGGTELVTIVNVMEHCDSITPLNDIHIRTPGA
ncbi:MAG: hypothetical protein ACXABY_07290 [Candidatus Thorarchaeota archaeon]|jgi:hypothetical protein